jgi:phosphatidylglycerophosphate synthase
VARQADARAGAPNPAPIGAKERDYWWTVLVVDPVALPITRVLARRRWFTPDQVTALSLVLGLATGPLYAYGERWSLIAGAVVYYLSFMLDCVDGKLARALNISSVRGMALDQMSDSARRASAVLGLFWFLLHDSPTTTNLFLLVAFGILSFYFMEISGAERPERGDGAGKGWTAALARRRLLPTPGMPDVSAVVYVIGPIGGFVVPAVAVGLAMVVAGIAITWARRLRGGGGARGGGGTT